jgi:lipopolysaccharide transport system permease protein
MTDRPATVIRPIHFAPASLLAAMGGSWAYRDLFLTLTAHRVKVRYKQSVLGFAWAVLQPLALMLIYTVMFTVIMRVERTSVPYPVFVYSALLPWTFFANAVSGSANSLVGHSALVTRVYFPREILPLSYVCAALVDFLIALVLLIALMAYYDISFTRQALFVIPIVMVLAMLATSISFFFSAAQARFRDVGVALPLVLQLLMFASPVIYPLSAVPAGARDWYMLNPLVGVITNFRVAILGDGMYDLRSLAVSLIASVVLVPLSYLYFKHVEATIADVL